jgi:hypothetical protein
MKIKSKFYTYVNKSNPADKGVSLLGDLASFEVKKYRNKGLSNNGSANISVALNFELAISSPNQHCVSRRNFTFSLLNVVYLYRK